jgi:hypothetical protein
MHWLLQHITLIELCHLSWILRHLLIFSHHPCLHRYLSFLLMFFVVFASFISLVPLVANWILEVLSVYSWGIHQLKKAIAVITPIRKSILSLWM